MGPLGDPGLRVRSDISQFGNQLTGGGGGGQATVSFPCQSGADSRAEQICSDKPNTSWTYKLNKLFYLFIV